MSKKFNPAFSMPSTPEEALECLEAWGDPSVMTFNSERAKKMHKLLAKNNFINEEKVKKEKVISVFDWDNLVCKTYNKIYSFQQQDGCQERGKTYITIPDQDSDYINDAITDEVNGYEMGVSFAAWLARDITEWNNPNDTKNLIKYFWYRNFYPELQTVANDLHAKGLIPEGKYIIEIDW
jgi:hypothetical protein